MRLLLAAFAAALALPGAVPLAVGQQGASSAPAGAPAAAPLSQDQLGALVAPIALYPDSLLAQLLMASTYPLEVAEAAQWQKANASLAGVDLQTALAGQGWDASVKSLVSFPQVLQMMGAQLPWTQQLGDAFLAQQKDVMAAVQALRAKAAAAGTLQTNTQQKVTTQTQGSRKVIVIQPAKPDVVYVPAYDPLVVYGAWPYPTHPPVAYYPPGFVAGTSALSFGAGMAVGASLWGGFHWGGGSVVINNNTYNNFNHWNHPYMPPGPGPRPYGPNPPPGPGPHPYGPHDPPGPGPHPNPNPPDPSGPRPIQPGGPGAAAAANRGGTSTWQHDPQHRGNVPYATGQLQQKYGSGQRQVQQERAQAKQAQSRAAGESRRPTGEQRPAGGAKAHPQEEKRPGESERREPAREEQHGERERGASGESREREGGHKR
jgi:hypothetical protein